MISTEGLGWRAPRGRGLRGYYLIWIAYGCKAYTTHTHMSAPTKNHLINWLQASLSTRGKTLWFQISSEWRNTCLSFTSKKSSRITQITVQWRNYDLCLNLNLGWLHKNVYTSIQFWDRYNNLEWSFSVVHKHDKIQLCRFC